MCHFRQEVMAAFLSVSISKTAILASFWQRFCSYSTLISAQSWTKFFYTVQNFVAVAHQRGEKRATPSWAGLVDYTSRITPVLSWTRTCRKDHARKKNLVGGNATKKLPQPAPHEAVLESHILMRLANFVIANEDCVRAKIFVFNNFLILVGVCFCFLHALVW